MDLPGILRSVHFLENLPEKDLANLGNAAQLHEYKEGDVIIQEGEEGNRLFVVVEGEVNVYKGYRKKNQKLFQTFGPKSYFGEMSLIDELSRSASVVAATDVTVLCIKREDFQNQIRRNPDLALDILKRLSLRVRTMNKIIMSTIGDIAPICMRCQKVCESDNNWVTVEKYIKGHSEMEVPQSLCPECSRAHFPKFYLSGGSSGIKI